jgi:predicted transcriptional regulator
MSKPFPDLRTDEEAEDWLQNADLNEYELSDMKRVRFEQALVEAARSIEAERSGIYDASPDELAAIDSGLEDVRQGRVASDEAVSAIRTKIRGE